jgi:IS5 family transposase
LPAEVLRLPAELARVDALLDDPVFFAPFAPYFHPVLGRPSTPVECYLRLMFLKFRYRLGYESLCAEVSDPVSWRRFCRIPLDAKVPHPTTLMKLTTRCGETAVAGLNETLWAKAAGAKLLRTGRVRADTTVIAANVVYPTDAGLLAKAVGKLVRAARRVRRRTGKVPRAVTADRGYGPGRGRTRPPRRGRAHDRDSPPGHHLTGPQDRRARPWLPPARQVAHRLRRPDQLPQTPLRLGPHPPGHHKGSGDLVRARGIRPQPGQDRDPRQLTGPPDTRPAQRAGPFPGSDFFRSK